MEKQAAVRALSALAQESRLDVYRALVQAGVEGESPGQIGERLGLPSATLSFHLNQLRHAGLITVRRSGRSLIYEARYDAMTELLGYLTENCCRGDLSACAIPTCLPASTQEPRPMTVTIYHNSACSASRNVLGMIRETGEEPVVIEYLKTPPSRETLAALAARMGVPLRSILREKGTPFKELGLDDPTLSDDQLLDAMMAHPILMNRPIVASPLGVKLCRPKEEVLDLLPKKSAAAE